MMHQTFVRTPYQYPVYVFSSQTVFLQHAFFLVVKYLLHHELCQPMDERARTIIEIYQDYQPYFCNCSHVGSLKIMHAVASVFGNDVFFREY